MDRNQRLLRSRLWSAACITGQNQQERENLSGKRNHLVHYHQPLCVLHIFLLSERQGSRREYHCLCVHLVATDGAHFMVSVFERVGARSANDYGRPSV